MLYLEDYLEMIEHLPQELRDRFTDMREMDLQVQNTMDTLEKRVKTFFSNAKKMEAQEKEQEYEAIRKDYYKTLEDADEKVQLANHMHDLVSRYLRRLEQETHKFKMELEADNMGITEILEKRSQELDLPPSNSCQKENRYSFTSHKSCMSSGTDKRKDSTAEHKRVVATLPEVRILPQSSTPPATPLPVVNYSLGHMGAGGTAIAAAASQAIAATQQMQQGRRTASLKASYEAINSVSISKELAGAAQTAIAAIQDTSKKNKKQKANVSSSSSSPALPVLVPSPEEPPQLEASADLSYDPNEPRYCICNEVAFGGMVACDNQTCPYEWFHYPCVGITDPPKGKWYCPQCTAAMKRRGARKN
ncbi:inhibitor of growth protein 3-like [Macrosteles quadrilineatus]|nr:inhibitor of growth protein 3-like isoform X2 [Macrosteles quadrilineatus]XP_054290904.1 inhibitor of growth protein 3-like [Macrosteles quadrilineatus]XP_054290905.1 inhibitor of growth protein 3-like [Macrosteles quadrilineatus]